MPVSYLVTVVVVGGFTALVLWPPTRPRVAALGGYLLGMVINEVPHLAAGVALAVATAQVLLSGDLGADPVSVLAVAGAILTAYGLGVVAARGIGAWDAVGSALREAGMAEPEKPRAWAWRTAVTPLPIRPRSVVRATDRRYGPHRRHRLDVYHRRDLPTGGPVLVYLHGGGYRSGSKHHEGRALLHRLASRGWMCVSATYRLRPEAGFEEHLADARAVLAWAREHAKDYGGDPDTLVMSGSSAGAHLTSLCALDPDCDITAGICIYGYYGRYYGRSPAETVVSTPFALSSVHAPPLFVAHGDRDTVTAVDDARELTSKLRRESTGPVVGVQLPGGQHGFDLVRSWRYSAVLAGIDSFLADPRVGLAQSASTTRKGPESG